jgi:hypothetical protein
MSFVSLAVVGRRNGNLSRCAGVSETGARRRNPERSEGSRGRDRDTQKYKQFPGRHCLPPNLGENFTYLSNGVAPE